jgi:hypothetical protein
MAEKKAATSRKPIPARPAYMVYTISGADELNVIAVTRKAEEALEAVDATEGANYLRFVLK